MRQVIFLQSALAFVLVLLGLLFFGQTVAISLFLGSFTGIFPSILFAFFLKKARSFTGRSYLLYFFMAESAKLFSAILLIIAIAKLCPSLHWPAYLAGLVISLQSVLLALLKIPSLQKRMNKNYGSQ